MPPREPQPCKELELEQNRSWGVGEMCPHPTDTHTPSSIGSCARKRESGYLPLFLMAKMELQAQERKEKRGGKKAILAQQKIN